MVVWDELDGGENGIYSNFCFLAIIIVRPAADREAGNFISAAAVAMPFARIAGKAGMILLDFGFFTWVVARRLGVPTSQLSSSFNLINFCDICWADHRICGCESAQFAHAAGVSSVFS